MEDYAISHGIPQIQIDSNDVDAKQKERIKEEKINNNDRLKKQYDDNNDVDTNKDNDYALVPIAGRNNVDVDDDADDDDGVSSQSGRVPIEKTMQLHSIPQKSKVIINSTAITNNNNSSGSNKAESSTGMRSRRKTSKYRGVSWLKRRKAWRSRIEYNGKQVHIGYYMSEEDAARAYDMKAMEICGNTTRLNFPNEVDANKLRDIISKQQQPSGDVITLDSGKTKTRKEMKRKRGDDDAGVEISSANDKISKVDETGVVANNVVVDETNMKSKSEDNNIKEEADNDGDERRSNKIAKRVNLSTNLALLPQSARRSQLSTTSSLSSSSSTSSSTVTNQQQTKPNFGEINILTRSDFMALGKSPFSSQSQALQRHRPSIHLHQHQQQATTNPSSLIPLQMQLSMQQNELFSPILRSSSSTAAESPHSLSDYQLSHTIPSPYANAPFSPSLPDFGEMEFRLLQGNNSSPLFRTNSLSKMMSPANASIISAMPSTTSTSSSSSLGLGLFANRRMSDQSQRMEATLQLLRRPSAELFSNIFQRYNNPNDGNNNSNNSKSNP